MITHVSSGSSTAAKSPESDGFLDVTEVSKQFKDRMVLDGIELSVSDKEFVTFLGPSGCGKTTLLRIVAGLESPSTGQVRFKGEDLTRHTPDSRPFNTVFQSYALFPNMSVEDNIGFGPRLAGDSPKVVRQRIGEMLELVRLQGLEKSAIDKLSGGQQQRVALARALINKPEVLLLDEPLSALDLQIRKHLQEELRSIQREIGGTFIYVTHDQEEALMLSDRIAVLEGGRIAQMGTPQDIYMRPADRFVAEFVGEANLLECRITDVTRRGAKVAFADGTGATFDVVDPGDLREGAKALAVVRPHEFGICDDKAEATLEGTVVEQIYLGDHVRYVVSTPGVGTVRVNGPLSGNAANSNVRLRLLDGCGHLIPDP